MLSWLHYALYFARHKQISRWVKYESIDHDIRWLKRVLYTVTIYNKMIIIFVRLIASVRRSWYCILSSSGIYKLIIVCIVQTIIAHDQFSTKWHFGLVSYITNAPETLLQHPSFLEHVEIQLFKREMSNRPQSSCWLCIYCRHWDDE